MYHSPIPHFHCAGYWLHDRLAHQGRTSPSYNLYWDEGSFRSERGYKAIRVVRVRASASARACQTEHGTMDDFYAAQRTGKATSLKQHEDPYTSSESATPRRLCDSGALLDRARKELPRRTTWHLAMGRARQEVLHPFLNVFNEYRSDYSINSNVCGKSIVVDEVCGIRVLVK